MQTFDRITSYLYGSSVGKVCKRELLEHLNIKCLILMIIQMKKNKTKFKLAIHSRSSIQNINNRRFWIRKNKCIIKFSKQWTRYIYLYIYIYMQKILMKQDINIWLTSVKKWVEYWYVTEGIFKNIEEHNLWKKCEVLIAFTMIAHKKLNTLVTELYNTDRKFNMIRLNT